VAVVLAGMVVTLDLLWGVLIGSTGSAAYGLVDLPAHLVTCAIALLALAVLRGAPTRAFVLAALAASVLLDLDHIPGYLGTQALTGTLPRPYAHTFLFLTLVLVTAFLVPRRAARPLLLGVAFGVAAHLFRDLATGPGVAVLWPFDSEPIQMPYVLYAGALLLTSIACLPQCSARLAHGLVTLLVLAAASLSLPAPSSASAQRVALGVYVPGSQENPGRIDSFASEVGRSPLIIANYEDWTQPLIDRPWLEAIWARGGVPLVTWEPWSWTDPGQRFPLRAIASGSYDSYIRRSAVAAAAWGHPILLRFAHEMNGTWYPWGEGHPAGAYKRAWRHVVKVFRASGADNVRWVWCPYVSNEGHLSFERYFPGDRWVDWVGLDGFNWGADRTWQSFGAIFANSYRALSRMSSRPIMIPETGSTEEGGNKARWISMALDRELPRFPRIQALVWFSDRFHTVEARVDSSASALAALRRGVSSPLFRVGREAFLLSTAHRR
jgi:membrane-bound metal-dependent hydrolase YbcI (DUF457 family)